MAIELEVPGDERAAAGRALPSSRASPLRGSTIDTMHDALHATSSADPCVRNRTSTANSVGQISVAPALTLIEAGAPSSAPGGTERVSLRTTQLACSAVSRSTGQHSR